MKAQWNEADYYLNQDISERRIKRSKMKDRIIKEMITNLDVVQRQFRDSIYRDIKSRELKPEFQRMSPSELLDYIETRIVLDTK